MIRFAEARGVAGMLLIVYDTFRQSSSETLLFITPCFSRLSIIKNESLQSRQGYGNGFFQFLIAENADWRIFGFVAGAENEDISICRKYLLA